MLKNRILAFLGAAAICAALTVGVVTLSPGFSNGSVKEGLCYEATGVSPDATAMKVDGLDVPMDMYYYNLCYAASYMESFINMYGMPLDWSMDLGDGTTVLDAVRESAQDNVKTFAVIEKLAAENNIVLDDEALAGLESQRESVIENLGGEEQYHAELAKIGLSEESYDRMRQSDYLYSALSDLASTEGSKLYPTNDELLSYAAEQGYMTADHILLLTKDMSTYESLDDETIAQKKALAEELLAKLEAYDGDDLAGYFAELADEYSEDSGRAGSPDGYTFGSGQMVAEFENAAAALGEGEFSEIVESTYGYHIILRKPLDEEQAIAAVSSGYFDTMLNRRVEEASVTVNPALEQVDVQAAYEAFVAAQSVTENGQDETNAG